jgi:hypothetical protein
VGKIQKNKQFYILFIFLIFPKGWHWHIGTLALGTLALGTLATTKKKLTTMTTLHWPPPQHNNGLSLAGIGIGIGTLFLAPPTLALALP